MTQQYFQKASNTFNRGLITEAGELTFPDQASVDELNCDLERDGSRRRRLGLQYESGYELSDYTVSSSELVTTHTWANVGDEAGVEFLVVQKGARLYFYRKSSSALSTQRINTEKTTTTPYVLDLNTFVRPTSSGADQAPISVTNINGALVVVSAELNPFYITRDKVTGAFSTFEISLKQRDFEWLGNLDEYTEQSEKNPSVERKYDTKNAGWRGAGGSFALSTYRSGNSQKWPPLNLPWYAGKDANGIFDLTEWGLIWAGNSLIANGHFIIDVWAKNRKGISEEDTLINNPEDGRFSTVASYAGRVFYSGIADSTDGNNSRIFFSQLLQGGFGQIGKCYQQNDPTSEVAPDLLDTDGGVINIPEAYNIQKLHVFGATLYVFAENGVWSISGVDDVFRATDYSVSKLTDIGIVYPETFVSAAGRPYWWSSTGIHTLVSGELQSIVEQNISLTTIQTFWNDIDSDVKARARGIYDSLENRVVWMYPEDSETNQNKLGKFLIFDEQLQAFFPWSVSAGSSGSYIAGASFFDGAGVGEVEFTVVDSNDDTVVDSNGDQVIITTSSREFSSSAIKYMVVDGATSNVTFASFTDIEFLDWGNTDYSSYVEGGYSFMGDLTTKKTVPYISPFFRVTETGWEGDENNGYNPIRESGCLVSHIWDFKTSASSTPQQAYRLRTLPVVDPDNLNQFLYPYRVVSTRLKLRGRGQSVRVRFESEAGKDFHLLGYEVVGAKNSRF